MVSAFIPGSVGAIPSESRRRLCTGACGSAGNWKSWHRGLVKEVESARALALGANTAGHGCGLHCSGGACNWSKTGGFLRHRPRMAVFRGTCAAAVSVRGMWGGTGMARMAPPATEGSSPGDCRDHDRCGNLGWLARFHTSQWIENSRCISVRRSRVIVLIHRPMGAGGREYFRSRRSTRERQCAALDARQSTHSECGFCAVRGFGTAGSGVQPAPQAKPRTRISHCKQAICRKVHMN